jgi:hypothetical protein
MKAGWFPRLANIIAMSLAVAVAAWLSFVVPIQQANLDLADGGWLAIAGTTISLAASVVGAAGAAYAARKL